MESKEVWFVQYKRGNKYVDMRIFDNKEAAEQFKSDNSYRDLRGKYRVKKGFEVIFLKSGARS